MSKHIIILLCLSWCIGNSYSQSTGFPTTTPLSHGLTYQWTGENGLVSNNITSVLQSSDGYLWITSYIGIIRFDGYRYELFDRKILPYLTTDSFYKVYEDGNGVLWFASQGSGIITYDRGVFKQLKLKSSLLPGSIRSLFVDKDNTIWAGANNKGLFQIHDSVVTKIDHALLNDVTVLDIKSDDNGVLWIGTSGNGLVRYDGKEMTQFTTAEGLSSNIVNAITIGQRGEAFVGTAGGFNIIQRGVVQNFPFLGNTMVNYILEDSYKSLWIGSDRGLARINRDQGLYELQEESNGFSYTRINHLCFDREGNLWLATGRSGLVQIKATGITNHSYVGDVKASFVNIVVNGPAGKLYVGLDDGTIYTLDHKKSTFVPIKSAISRAGIRDICFSDDGTMWIATYNGIVKKKGDDESLLTTNNGFPANDFRRIIRDDDGNVWFGSRSGGLVKYANNRIVAKYDTKNGLSSNYILAIEKDRSGNLYVGTHSGGMSIIDREGNCKTFPVKGDDSGILIFNVHIDDEGKVWVISNIGPLYFDGKKFIPLTLATSVGGLTFFDWVEDATGHVWITTNMGVLRMSKEDVRAHLSGATASVKTKLYDHTDGMMSKECTAATRTLVAPNGEIFVPTISGVTTFHPGKMKENSIIPPVYVTGLVTDNGRIETREKAIIPPGNFRYTLEYTALTFISVPKVKFKYKLEPLDNDWINANTKREAEYTNIPPGDYTFRVIACNNNGLWNEEGDAFQFTVRPFYYQTAWFYIVIILLSGFLLYWIYRWRVMVIEKRNVELRKVNNELDRFVYSASHDLRAPLASILGLVNLSRMDAGSKEYYIDMIEKSVKRLDGFIRDIIDFSRNARLDLQCQQIDFNKLIQEVMEDLKYLDPQNSVRKIITVSGSGVFHSDKVRIEVILSNLISNAFKYSKTNGSDQVVEILVEYDHENAVIAIKDNGIGISEEHYPHIFKMFYRGSEQSHGSGLGLYIVKETVDKIHGHIEVQSKIGAGSRFTLQIPSLVNGEVKKLEVA